MFERRNAFQDQVANSKEKKKGEKKYLIGKDPKMMPLQFRAKIALSAWHILQNTNKLRHSSTQ